MPTAVDFQPMFVTLGDVSLGAVEAETWVEWILEKVEGWESSASTIDVQQKAQGNGGWAGKSFLAPKTVTLSGTMHARSPFEARDAYDRLIAANSLADTRLTVTQWGKSEWSMVRRQDVPLIEWISPRAFTWSLQMVALDPRRFGDTQSLSLELPQTVNGLTVPVTVPFSIPSYRNTAELTNDGITAGPVTLRVTGPVVNPVITHNGSSGTQVFAMRITLGDGEWLDIDMDAHTVLAQGMASRNGYITQRGWHSFDPGLNSWAFSADQYSPALLSITATPAY